MVLRRRPKRALAPVLVGLAPALLWLAFATFYYGFPLPNTYYAKVANGIPRFPMMQAGRSRTCSTAPTTIRSRLATVALALLVGVADARASSPRGPFRCALCDLHRQRWRRLHERPILRDAISRRRHGRGPRGGKHGRAVGARGTGGLQHRDAHRPDQDHVALRRRMGVAHAERHQGRARPLSPGHEHPLLQPLPTVARFRVGERGNQFPQWPGEGDGPGKHRVLRPVCRPGEVPRRSQRALRPAARPHAGLTAALFRVLRRPLFQGSSRGISRVGGAGPEPADQSAAPRVLTRTCATSRVAHS